MSKKATSTTTKAGGSRKRPAREGEGRPKVLTDEQKDFICELIASTSLGLNAICEKVKCVPSTIFRALREDEKFCDNYTRAKQDQADFMANEIHDVSDEAIKLAKRGVSPFRLGALMQAYKLKVEALKWTASKLKPKKYGDKLDVTSDGEKVEGNILWLGKHADKKK